MTDKVRIQLNEHCIIEPAQFGVIVYMQSGSSDIQEDVVSHQYVKRVYTDKEEFIEFLSGVYLPSEGMNF